MHLSEQAIRQHLNNVLESREFKRKPTLQSFLRFIVEMTLLGQAHQIKGSTVATQVFGKGSGFDPLRDAIVRVQAGRLRTSLERYYQSDGGQDPVRIKISKGTYIPIFEENHTTRHRELQARTTSPETPLARAWGPSVAVMPLFNLSGDPRQDYFADGVTEEVTNELARCQDLLVISSYSTLRWKNREIAVSEVGQELGVRFLVMGSIRKETDRIKICVSLVDAPSGTQIWAEQYRRGLSADTLIALQEEIGQTVAARIASEFGVIPRILSLESRQKPPESLETYEAFLRFIHHITIFSPETYLEAFNAIETATTREPNCGLAWSYMGILYCQNHTLELSSLDTPLEDGLDFAHRGVSLDPQNQWGRTALANAYFHLEDRDSFLREAIEALNLNPNSPTLTGIIGWMMVLYGEWEQGLTIFAKAIEVNPYYPGWFHSVPYLDYFRQGKYAEAYREAQQFRMPLFFWDPLLRAAALGQLGSEVEAGKALAELLQLRPGFAAAAGRLIGHHVKVPSVADALLDGLRKAGLDV